MNYRVGGVLLAGGVMRVNVSKKFVADFKLVSEHYLLEEHGELEVAKQAARQDLENAITTYAALANEIRGQA